MPPKSTSKSSRPTPAKRPRGHPSASGRKTPRAQPASGGTTPRSRVAQSSAAAAHRARPRTRPGTKALREIRRYQKSTELLIPKLPFQRFTRGIADENKTDTRFTAGALAALQTATEAFVIGMLEDANLAAIHTKRVTVMPKDVKLVSQIRNITKKQA